MSEKDLVQRFRDTQKMNFVVESWDLRGEDLGRFLRENGLSSIEIMTWRDQMGEGLEEGKPLDKSVKKSLENRIKLLEEENRQLRVLNELQKKAQKLIEVHEAKSLEKRSGKTSSSSSKKVGGKGSVKKRSV